MVYGTLLHIESNNKEDSHLYGNPKLTYFKSVFRKGNNFAIEYNKLVKKSNNIKFGDTIVVEIPHSGDLLSGIYLDFKLTDLKRKIPYIQRNLKEDTSLNPRFTSYVNGIGFNIIDTIDLEIGGRKIQRLNNELIYIINELHSDANQVKYFYHNSKYYQDFSIGNVNHSNVRCHVSLPFYFSNDPGSYVPLSAILNSKIELKIKLKEFDKCIVREYNPFAYDPANYVTTPGLNGYKRDSTSNRLVPNPDPPEQYSQYIEDVTGGIDFFDIITQNIYISKEERNYFINNIENNKGNLQYLIELYHIGDPDIIEAPIEDTVYTVDIDSKHPTKYISWILQREDVLNDNYYQNYTYDYRAKYGDGFNNYDIESHLLETMEITVENNPLFKDINPIFLSNIQKFEKFKSHSCAPIYVYNFSLRPNHSNPSGSINLSMFNNKSFSFTLADKNNYTNNNFTPRIVFRYYSKYYNVLTIENGLASLVYE